MKKAISLHIGLNYVNPEHYTGWDGKLNAAEFDAHDMELICRSEGFETSKLIREEATRDNVQRWLAKAASELSPEGILVVSYSGHGGQLPDQNKDEVDALDETWCLFDGQLIDDELSVCWSKFKQGTRIFVISDSCHSGTVIKAMLLNTLQEFPEYLPKHIPDTIASSTYLAHRSFYDKILENVREVKSEDIKASVKLISGCQDNQSSYDGKFNGEFTRILKIVWNGAKFRGDYSAFHKQIGKGLPDRQSPNYYNVGSPNPAFDSQKPFTI